MQEIAILLSSVAGVATAAAIRNFPRTKSTLLSLGANSQIKNQINSLKIEKEILTKTISRLYQHHNDLTKIQRDQLLVRYQHQLGMVLAKMEKLEDASKHPDLGPVGDGLITLMDQKLSQLDSKLYEISSKISVASEQVHVEKPKVSKITPEVKEKPKEPEVEIKKEIIPEQKPVVQEKPEIEQIPQMKPRHVEITTLTELPNKISEFPLIEQKPKPIQMEIVEEQIQKPKVDEKIEIIQASVSSNSFEGKQEKIEVPKPEIQTPPKPKPTVKLPDEESIEDEDDDIDKIKGEIMKTLSKLEQAEVE